MHCFYAIWYKNLLYVLKNNANIVSYRYPMRFFASGSLFFFTGGTTSFRKKGSFPRTPFSKNLSTTEPAKRCSNLSQHVSGRKDAELAACRISGISKFFEGALKDWRGTVKFRMTICTQQVPPAAGRVHTDETYKAKQGCLGGR